MAAAVRKNIDLLQNAWQEPYGLVKEREAFSILAHQMGRLFQAIDSLEFAVRDNSSDEYSQNFEAGLERLEDGVSAAFASLAKSITAAKDFTQTGRICLRCSRPSRSAPQFAPQSSSFSLTTALRPETLSFVSPPS